MIAAATDTLRLSTWPYIGIAPSASHASRVDGLRPLPSPPRTSAIGGTSSRSKSGRPLGSAPTTCTPALLSHLSTLPRLGALSTGRVRSEEHTSELQSRENLVCRLLLEKKK